MYTLAWTVPALGDLRKIEAWLERERSPAFALRTLMMIRHRARFLEDFPRGGRPYQGELRVLRILETPYLLRYRILEASGAVQILRVHHEREDWQTEV